MKIIITFMNNGDEGLFSVNRYENDKTVSKCGTVSFHKEN